MTETIGAGGSGAYPTKEHAIQAAADRIGKKEAHAMTEHYYKPVGAGDGMGTVVVDADGMRAELTAARARIAELEAALTYYGDQFCEGLCREYGPNFDENTCSGCKARAALAKRAK